jgi:hypothetical protein
VRYCRLTFPIEQDGTSTSVVIPHPQEELPLQPVCMSVMMEPYGDTILPLSTGNYDQTGRAVVSP